jgi:hypothetical protein
MGLYREKGAYLKNTVHVVYIKVIQNVVNIRVKNLFRQSSSTYNLISSSDDDGGGEDDMFKG